MTTINTPVSVPGSAQTPASVPGSVQRHDDPNIHGVAETKAFFSDQVHRLHRRDRRGAAGVLLGQGEPTGTLTIPRPIGHGSTSCC